MQEDSCNTVVNKLDGFGSCVLLSKSYELLADTETPVSTFLKLCNKKEYSFLLESVEGGEKIGRYSIIGFEPILIFKNQDNKTTIENLNTKETKTLEDNGFIALDNLLRRIKVSGNVNNNFLGFIGYFSYESIRWVEPKTNFKPCKNIPDAYLILPGKLVIFDHVLHKVKLIANLLVDENKNENANELENKLNNLIKEFNQPKVQSHLVLNFENNLEIKFKSNFTKEQYISMVNKCKEYIKAGDIFQVVPSQKLRVEGRFNGLTLYRTLRSINPSPYLFYINFSNFELCGSSPEVMVKSEFHGENKKAYLRPIAGTYPRGSNDEEDKKNIQTLLGDEKERAEHLMLVDLARNDLGRVCETGSIKVKELMVIEKYSHVLHIVSLVEGIMKKGKTAIDLLTASFPAGTLSGAPKVRALQIINELEKDQRGQYGGCLGFFGLDDTINTCMTIRTFLIFKDYLEIQAGGGVVADSDPENEYKETLRKSGALLKALSVSINAHEHVQHD